LEAEARQISAEIAVRQGDPQSAALHLQEALVLKESQLRAKRSPSVYLMEASFRNDAGLKLLENFELSAFRSYADTQLRLAKIMHSLGKPYEAERLLGECVNTAYTLSEAAGDKSLDNMALFGGTWTAVAELIAMDRPEEVEQARSAADHIWQITAAKFPGAVRHPNLSPQAIERLTWHSQNGAPRLSAELWKSYARAILPKIAFIDRARGLRWFDRADWNDAIMWFKRSAEARKSNQAYDWFYIAMAEHHQGNPDEAKSWFKKAVAAITEPHTELIELRGRVESLLKFNEIEDKESVNSGMD
jgi:tetratricopeptide (TPR) repeat protein